MSDLFTRMCCRMDGATVRVMGKQAEINGVVYDVMPEEESAEMGGAFGQPVVTGGVFSPVPSGPS
ncbi:phage protein [Escherichia coli]|nr:phage protein [Escherichia coli]